MIAVMQLEISSIFDRAQERAFEEGAPVFRAGAPVTNAFLVRHGCAVLVRALENGSDVYLQRAHAGEVLAEASVYADCYHCDCVALQPTVLAMLPRDEFREILRGDSALSENWAAHLARTIQRTRMRLEISSLKTVSERLDAWIAEHGPLPEKGQWQSVAHELSISREALYRELARRRKA